ncbi:hypothetical protein M885DRAFT_308773 [Pelagophyceae sp. CCMP2097]|nr:hypothetical protein M885DRAFT_308773 [Pelagophyceae sp. CCMP2097]
MSEAVNDGPLRLKPKTKSVPRIKMKSDKKKEGAPVPPVDDDAGLAAAEEPDLFDAFADDDAPAGAFDPRGANGGGFADFGSAPQPFAAQFSAPAFEPQYAAAAPQAYAQQPQFADFDAAPAPAQPAQPAQQRMMGGFSDFSSAPAYAQQPTYSQAPPAQPMQPMQPMQPIGGMQPMGGMMQQGYAPQMMQQQPPPQQSYGQSGQSEDFGDFAQSAPPPQRLPQYDAPPAKKAGLDSLVSLDGLSLNTTRSPQAAPAQPRHGGSHGHHAASPQYGRGHSPQDSAAAHAAFTGLDGFTTSQQSMIATPQAQRMPAQQQGYAPQQGYAAQAPMQQYGSPQAQQAYGAPPPQMMGGYMQQQMPQQQQMPPQQMYGQQPQYGQQQQQQYGQQQPW